MACMGCVDPITYGDDDGCCGDPGDLSKCCSGIPDSAQLRPTGVAPSGANSVGRPVGRDVYQKIETTLGRTWPLLAKCLGQVLIGVGQVVGSSVLDQHMWGPNLRQVSSKCPKMLAEIDQHRLKSGPQPHRPILVENWHELAKVAKPRQMLAQIRQLWWDPGRIPKSHRSATSGPAEAAKNTTLR